MFWVLGSRFWVQRLKAQQTTQRHLRQVTGCALRVTGCVVINRQSEIRNPKSEIESPEPLNPFSYSTFWICSLIFSSSDFISTIL